MACQKFGVPRGRHRAVRGELVTERSLWEIFAASVEAPRAEKKSTLPSLVGSVCIEVSYLLFGKEKRLSNGNK